VQVRDVAFGERGDVDAGESEALEEAGGVFLVATESVQRFREDDVEPPVQRVPHQCLESGAQQRGTGDRVIGELVDNPPALAGGKLATDAELVRDRRVALIVGGVTARRSRPSLHRHLRSILRLSGELACERLACGLSSERANEHAQRFVTTIARCSSSHSASRLPTALLSRPDHNAATPHAKVMSALGLSPSAIPSAAIT
jgi:hypothetical protein